ncbi:Flp family type IVb pilin [Limnohabitans parvus]|nr:Flp family type IVb pilin [Limnohabitans parvus]
MKTKIQNFINDESGATAIEYGLLAALWPRGFAPSLCSA